MYSIIRLLMHVKNLRKSFVFKSLKSQKYQVEFHMKLINNVYLYMNFLNNF